MRIKDLLFKQYALYPRIYNADSPVYRVVRPEHCAFSEVFGRIDSLLKSRERINIAIDGNCGAGKSTLALLIGSRYECNIFHMDDFFLPPELKTEERLKEVGGNIDYVRFKQEVLDGLNSGSEFRYHQYDCKQKIMGEMVLVNPQKLNVIEGSYSMHPTLANNYDLKIFLSVEEKEQYARILKRSGAGLLQKFLSEWIPLENHYFQQLQIEEQCDLVLRS